jgi:hypothetical protein
VLITTRCRSVSARERRQMCVGPVSAVGMRMLNDHCVSSVCHLAEVVVMVSVVLLRNGAEFKCMDVKLNQVPY